METTELKTLVCGIAKLENNYIREWVEHYKKLGFTNVVIYDNNDPDGERFESGVRSPHEDGLGSSQNNDQTSSGYSENKRSYSYISSLFFPTGRTNTNFKLPFKSI